ncbi:unnamed protein product [Acanthoscelides obtectus]|uniref:Uncharacterized protein n=1 Tax=Acanthoscelides obtectus TaxID=200917 RepID=A0A9P0KGS0_ACAOB|nr:unnamed protein product [Acanthoscelides obtectus]CAK1639592.1 hypothetical protein AOBTE_LOCUS11259 [Acanthoscelides obtectus]
MVRTGGGIRISGGKSTKKSGGSTASSGSSSGSNRSGSQASGSRLPPIPHVDVPTWQKPITNFFNSGAAKPQEKHSDVEKNKKDTVSSKTQKTFDDQQAQSSNSSSSRSVIDNKLVKKDGEDFSSDEDKSHTKVPSDLKDILQESSATASAEEENCDQDRVSINEKGAEQVNSHGENRDTETTSEESVPQPVINDADSLDKQNKVLEDVTDKSTSNTDASNDKEDSCDKNESMPEPDEKCNSDEMSENVLVDVSSKNNKTTELSVKDSSNNRRRPTNPVEKNVSKEITIKKKVHQKEAVSVDGEKRHADEINCEPAVKKMKK